MPTGYDQVLNNASALAVSKNFATEQNTLQVQEAGTQLSTAQESLNLASSGVTAALLTVDLAKKDLETEPSNEEKQSLYNQAIDGLNAANKKFKKAKEAVDEAFQRIAASFSGASFWCDIPIFGLPLINDPDENPGFEAESNNSLSEEDRARIEEQVIGLILAILDSLIPLDVIKLIVTIKTLYEIFADPRPTWDEIKLMLCTLAEGYESGNVPDAASLNPLNTPTETGSDQDFTKVYRPKSAAQTQELLNNCQDNILKMLKNLPCALLQYMLEPILKSTEIFTQLFEGIGELFEFAGLSSLNPMEGSASAESIKRKFKVIEYVMQNTGILPAEHRDWVPVSGEKYGEVLFSQDDENGGVVMYVDAQFSKFGYRAKCTLVEIYQTHPEDDPNTPELEWSPLVTKLEPSETVYTLPSRWEAAYLKFGPFGTVGDTKIVRDSIVKVVIYYKWS